MYLTIRLDDLRPRGPGLWKFNNSLLQDTNFSEYISDRMNALIEGMEHFPSVKLWWDFFKNSLKAEIISFSKTKRKNLSHERVVLTKEIIKLKALLVAGDFFSPVEGFLSLQELSKVVGTLNLDKSPGSDGFSVEFSLHFWEILGPLLLRVANQCFRDGNL